MQISARNQLKGTVKNVEHGAVNSEVTLELSGDRDRLNHHQTVGGTVADNRRQSGLCCYQSN